MVLYRAPPDTGPLDRDMGEAALSGSLETVGLFDLLRIPMSTARTGTLIVVNSDHDVPDPEARLHYRDGSLVWVTIGETHGEHALRTLIGWKDGVFEFLADTPPPERIDPRLHALALTEIKNWYAAKTSSRPAVANGRSSPALHLTPRPGSISRPEMIPAALRAVPRAEARPEPRGSTIGSGALDARANLSEVTGTLLPKDGAIAFASLQVAAAIGKDLAMGAPVSIELHGRGERWLGAAVRGDGAVLVVCPPDAHVAEELARKLGGS